MYTNVMVKVTPRRVALSVLAFGLATASVAAVVRQARLSADPCARRWGLPAYDEAGNPNLQSMAEIFNCYEVTGTIDKMCPPPDSDWHRFLGPDSGCP
jgi:hypothetical protein